MKPLLILNEELNNKKVIYWGNLFKEPIKAFATN